jgi:hypothetical protein
MNKSKAKAATSRKLPRISKETRKRVRKANARKRTIKRHCRIHDAGPLGGYCCFSRLLAGQKICKARPQIKRIDDLKACPLESKK